MAVRLARGGYLAFIDHDTVVDPSWLRQGLIELRHHRRTGLLHRPSVFGEPDLISNAGLGADGTWSAGQSTLVFGKPRHVLYAIGAALLISAATFTQLGGFDEEFFIGYDDVDLGWRARLLGFDPDAFRMRTRPITILAVAGFEQSGHRRLFEFYGVRNLLCMLLQNLSGRSLLITVYRSFSWHIRLKPFVSVENLKVFGRYIMLSS